MCGINGIIHLDSKQPVQVNAIETMNRCMLHRGPDAGGLYVQEHCGLGHRRLKIIDLEGGVQPMYSPDNNLVLVFNGEIYNYQTIRENLEARGHTFRTHSDTEVIIEAYKAWGKDCVDHFRGMFAFALFDKNENSLFICRDRVGIKPLYYAINENQFLFSSEVKPILSQLENKPSVRTDLIDFYFSVGYVPGENTLFEKIQKLLPGHCLEIKNGCLRSWCYWDLSLDGKVIDSEPEAMEKFDFLLNESVNLRMVSDVPLGAFLSGGLDSSAIVAKMSELSDSPVKTFSVGYENAPELSELKYAKQVAEHFNTEHHEYILQPLDFFESTNMLLNFSEEPIVESAAIALYQLSKVAKESVTVILSGEGGDEVLAGYPLHQIMPKVNRLRSMISWLPDRFIGGIGGKLANSEKKLKYLDWLQLPLAKRYQSISNDVTRSIKRKAYWGQQLMDSEENTRNYYRNLFEHLPNGVSDLQRMTYADIKSWLPDDLLVKADKMTMAASLELRVPLLDHKLMEFCSRLPDHLRIHSTGGDKYLLRQLMRKKLPSSIIDRKKQGFPVPLAGWLRNELYEQTAEILLDQSSLNRGYFDPQYIAHILKQHRTGQQDLSRRIFSLLTLELWHRKYID